MYDRQTSSLWTQVDGQARRGELAGTQLQIVPAIHATWKEWLAMYPHSQVLRKSGRIDSPYRDYNLNPQRLGIMGRRNVDKRLPGKERILGLRIRGAAMAFPLGRVRRAGLAQADVGGTAVLLVAPAGSLPVLAYERRLRGRDPTFRLERVGDRRVLRDVETNSTWDVASGKAIEGPLTGAQLTRATAYPAFWFGWRGYFPASAVWEPNDE